MQIKLVYQLIQHKREVFLMLFSELKMELFTGDSILPSSIKVFEISTVFSLCWSLFAVKEDYSSSGVAAIWTFWIYPVAAESEGAAKVGLKL